MLALPGSQGPIDNNLVGLYLFGVWSGFGSPSIAILCGPNVWTGAFARSCSPGYYKLLTNSVGLLQTNVCCGYYL